MIRPARGIQQGFLPMAEPAAAPQQGLKQDGPPLEPLPKQFGKYTLLRRLAAGGMAEIFLALHRSVAGFEKLVVIKRILPSMNQNKAFIDMLLHEARVAATLSHPNIVQTFDVGNVDGTYFIAMEHIHGEDIQAIVRAMKKKDLSEFPLEHTLGIITGMCAGLAYAHDKRDLDGKRLDIVHRDISPRNIVISFTGDVKIVDFGIAKSGVEPGEDTANGQLKGKAPYMSPEQAAGQPIDWRSDIFATGVMLFELTTGKRLFKGASEFETLKLIIEKEYPKPSDVRPGYPQALERIVMRALAKNREERYESAREMQSDIETYVRNERIPVSQVSLTKWMEYLFEDKIAQQKEALQDIKQLADVIAAQHSSLYDATSTYTTMPAATAPSVPPIPPKRSNAAAIAAVTITVALVGGGIFYVKHEDGVRDAQARQAAAPLPGDGDGATAQAKGAIDLASTPAGCAIWIDGDLRAEVTPARIEKLPLGKAIKVKLTKEGFEAFHADLTLSDAEPNKKLAAEMKTGSVTILLKIDPPPTIWLDGKPWKGERGKLDGLSAGEDHKIVASANGYLARTYTINAKQGETKTITDQLQKGDPVAAAAAAEKPAEKQAPAAGPPGKVRVGAKGGFCNVTVNGTSYGPTPVEAIVPAGTARVSCKPANGPSQSQSVTVGPGDTARVSFKIEE
jgi:serine/threonine-protein kinase